MPQASLGPPPRAGETPAPDTVFSEFVRALEQLQARPRPKRPRMQAGRAR
jgi:hypothetical protein